MMDHTCEIGQYAITHVLGDKPGSSFVDIAVEPTRSTNMTVSWRRSAVSGGLWFISRSGLRCRRRSGGPGKLGNGSQHLQSVCEQDTQVLEMLLGQVRGQLSRSPRTAGRAGPYAHFETFSRWHEAADFRAATIRPLSEVVAA